MFGTTQAWDYHRDVVSTLGLRGTVPPEHGPRSLAQHTFAVCAQKRRQTCQTLPFFLLGMVGGAFSYHSIASRIQTQIKIAGTRNSLRILAVLNIQPMSEPMKLVFGEASRAVWLLKRVRTVATQVIKRPRLWKPVPGFIVHKVNFTCYPVDALQVISQITQALRWPTKSASLRTANFALLA